jgi:hypothetical protein
VSRERPVKTAAKPAFEYCRELYIYCGLEAAYFDIPRNSSLERLLEMLADAKDDYHRIHQEKMALLYGPAKLTS